jgi:hypothetical protein
MTDGIYVTKVMVHMVRVEVVPQCSNLVYAIKNRIQVSTSCIITLLNIKVNPIFIRDGVYLIFH